MENALDYDFLTGDVGSITRNGNAEEMCGESGIRGDDKSCILAMLIVRLPLPYY